MRRIIALSGCSLLVAAFMSETCETVLVQGGKDGPVRVNKDEFDADQEKDAGDRQYKAYTGKQDAEQSQQTSAVQLTGGDPPLAAPSAPDFTGGDGAAPSPVDPLKNAAAPVSASPNQRLVMKDGAKYVVVDGTGTKIEMDGVDSKGYKTEQAAWDAIKLLPH